MKKQRRNVQRLVADPLFKVGRVHTSERCEFWYAHTAARKALDSIRFLKGEVESRPASDVSQPVMSETQETTCL